MNNSDISIVSRPFGGIWGMLALMLLFCIGAVLIAVFDPPKPERVWTVWFIGGVPGTVAVGLSLYIARHRILADQGGLRWCGALTRWKSARWDEVADFYIARRSKEGQTYQVETARGTLVFGANDTMNEELAAFIARSATQTRYREWGDLGLRPDEEFERTLVTPAISWRAVLLVFVPLMALSLFVLPYLRPHDFEQWQAARALDSADVAAWALWAPFVFMAFCISTILTALLAPIVSAHEKREQVIVTQQGLRFEKDAQTLDLLWDELRAVHLRNERAHFASARGDWRMHWLSALRPFIEQYAPNATFDSESDNLDLEHPIQLANGARYYSFRTTNLRLMLRVFTALTVLWALMPPLMLIGVTPEDLPRDDPRGVWIMVVPFGAFCLWLWRLYQRGGIALSEAGIEVRGAWRNQFYHWDEIEKRDEQLVVSDSGRRVRLWSVSTPVRSAEVRDEIKRQIG